MNAKPRTFAEQRNQQPAKQGTRFDATGTYVCVICGKRTRNTNTGEAGTGLCKKCYQQCEQENLESDEE